MKHWYKRRSQQQALSTRSFAHIDRTRGAHQVIAIALHILQYRAYSNRDTDTEEDYDYDGDGDKVGVGVGDGDGDGDGDG